MITSHILNTRPTHQSQHLTRLIHEAGGSVSHLPLFNIEEIHFQPIKIDNFDSIIFLSANAVNFFFATNDKSVSRANIIAIGPATRHALEKHGFHSTFLPTTFSSEGIIAMPMLQKILHQSIAIISGENPKPLLRSTLIASGAHITSIMCYARRPMTHHMEVAFPVLKKNKIALVICTSQESLSQLMTVFENPKHREWLIKRALCVINADMKHAALNLGFTQVIQADNATDEAIVRAISS